MKKRGKPKPVRDRAGNRVVCRLIVILSILLVVEIGFLVRMMIAPIEHQIVYYVFFSLVSSCALGMIIKLASVIFKPALEKTKAAVEGNTVKKSQKIHGLRLTLGIICLLFIGGSVTGLEVTKYYSQSPSDQKTDHAEHTFRKTPKYNFLEITNQKIWDDRSLYFFDAKDQNDFVNDLVESFECIEPIEPISYEELNIASGYGDIVDGANDHFIQLGILLSSEDTIIHGPLPEVCYEYILSVRDQMEETYATPDNRKEIMTCYLFGGLNGLGESPQHEYEQAVRYSWGVLAIRFLWGDYQLEDVQNIVTAYEHLQSVNQEQNQQIEFIVVSVKRMGMRFEEKYG